MTNDPFFHVPRGSKWNACIGKQGNPLAYAEGYIEAALELATQIVDQKLFGQRDTLVMPILYNARHSIELHLKIIIDRLVECGLVATNHQKNHDIASHLLHLETAVVPDRRFRETLEALRPYVESLSQIDDDGQELRYFENREGDRSLGDRALANIEVIRVSLVEMKEVLRQFESVSCRLNDEKSTLTHTSRLSRADLYDIARKLPAKDQWNSGALDKTKLEITKSYSIGSRQFSLALDKIQQTRELKSMIGIETALEELDDKSALFLARQWRILHPKVTSRPLGLDYMDTTRFDKLKQNLDNERMVYTTIEQNITPDTFADAEAIFYITRDRVFPEHYEALLKDTQRRFSLENDYRRNIADLMSKTSFLDMFIKGVRQLGRKNLAKDLAMI